MTTEPTSPKLITSIKQFKEKINKFRGKKVNQYISAYELSSFKVKLEFRLKTWKTRKNREMKRILRMLDSSYTCIHYHQVTSYWYFSIFKPFKYKRAWSAAQNTPNGLICFLSKQIMYSPPVPLFVCWIVHFRMGNYSHYSFILQFNIDGGRGEVTVFTRLNAALE